MVQTAQLVGGELAFGETFNRVTVKRLYDMQRDLITLRLAVGPMQDIISQLVRMHPTLIPEKLGAYFRDVYDHVFRVNESISAMREMLGATININLSLVTFRQNEVMKKLAGGIYAWLRKSRWLYERISTGARGRGSARFLCAVTPLPRAQRTPAPSNPLRCRGSDARPRPPRMRSRRMRSIPPRRSALDGASRT